MIACRRVTLRSLLIASVVVGVFSAGTAMAGPLDGTAGLGMPPPCAAGHAATAAAGQVTTAFRVACNADTSYEVTSIGQHTTIRDLSVGLPARTCDQTVPGVAASQTCSMPSQRLHSYLVTFEVTVFGNYAVCSDDGTCVPSYGYPACSTTPADWTKDVWTVDYVCTFHQVVTATT